MNPKVNFWAILTSLAAIVSVFATVPVHAASAPTESMAQRIAKLREAMAQQQVGQSSDVQKTSADSTLISQWDNVTGSGWTNTPTWINWNNSDVTNPSWSNGWGNWDNT